MELKPTFEKPLSKAGKTIDKEFNPHLTEVDAVLNEKEQSFKKKVWDLSKMESLVFSDPKLNAKYDDMSEDGQEKYGYHYNETIMNMLFNEYVTNDSGYRQKYLNAIPDEKERRDKSGIHQLQQKGEEKMQRNSAAPKARTEGDVPTHNNSLEGVIEEDGIMDNNLNHDGGGTFDDREYLNHRINKKYDTTPNTMDTNEDLHKGNVYRLNKQSSDQGSISQLNKDAMNDPDPLNIDGYDTRNRKYDTMDIDVDDKYQENPYESEIKETTASASSGAFSTALGAKNNVYEDGKKSSFAHVAGTHKDYSNSEKSVGQANKDAMADTDPLSMDDIRDYDRKNREYDTMSIDTPDSYQENPYESVNKGKIIEGKETDEKRSKLYNDALKKFGFNVKYDSDLSDEQRKKVSDYIKSNMSDPNAKTVGQTLDPNYVSENEDCKDCDEEKIDETTTSSSSGAYEGPFRKKGKNHVTNKPAWKGGEIIGENYLIDSKFFKRIYNDLKLNEGFSSPNNDSRVPMAEYDMTNDKESMEFNLNRAYQEMSNLMKKSDPASKQAYENIKKTAQNIASKLGKPFKEPSKGGFMSTIKRGLGMGEGELHEHHLEGKDEKIQYILKMGKNKFGDAEMLNHLDDADIDRIYLEVEQNQTAINPLGEDIDDTYHQEKMNSYEDDYNYEDDIESQKDNEMDWFIIVKGNDTNITREDKLEGLKKQGWGITDGPMDVHSANTELDDIMRMQSGGRTTARNFGWNEFDMGESKLRKPELKTPMLRESIGSLQKVSDFVSKYNLTPTGNNNKYKIDDFQPVLTNPIDKDDQYDLAMLFATSVLSQYMMDWDDLGDINSLWDVAEAGHRDMKSFASHAKELANERLSDVDGGMFEGKITEDYLDKNGKPIKIIPFQNDPLNTPMDTQYNTVSNDYTPSKVPEGIDEKAKSKSQQQFMGMVHAAQKGELENPSASVEKVAKEMKPDDVEDFASTKHKGLPDKVPTNEATDGWEGIVQYDSEKTDEEPFELGNGTKWQEVWAIYPNGTRDIGYYRFGHDLTYSWDYFNKTILGQRDSNEIVGEGEVNEAGGRNYVSYKEATNLANILDNTPVEQEEKIIQKFASGKELSLPEFKYHVQQIIKSRLEGSDSPEYFKMENLITIVNDMIDQGHDQTGDMMNRVKQDRDQDAKLRNAPSPEKKSKMQKAGEDVWADFDPMTFSMGESENLETSDENIAYHIAELLKKLYPDQYDNIEDFKKFADLTVKTFFGGNYNKAFSEIKRKMSELMSSNEGMISGTEGSVIGDNGTSMANTMKDVQGSSPDMPDGMFEDDKHNLDSHGRSDDVKFDDKNALGDFGSSKGGLTGFNDQSDGYYPEYKKPEKEGAPRNKDLGKYDSMTVKEEIIMGVEVGDGENFDIYSLEDAMQDAQSVSKSEGVAQHVNNDGSNGFYVDDFFDSDNTVFSYSNGELINSFKHNLDVLYGDNIHEGEEKKLDEEGQCRRDEKPVAGVLAGEKGACEKKNKKTKTDKAGDNKFNVKFRHKQEKERENKIEKKHTDYKKELDQNKKHMKKLKEMVEGTETIEEAAQHPSMTNLNRLKKDNTKNFKADVKNSNSAEIAADQDELTAKEQIEEVPDNPYELAEKIEKDKMKQHEFNSFENEGNSTNDTNKDIPKRNATDDEADDIMLNRGLGMQDIVYDNKPDERFDERMKKDMGEQIYDQRQEKMEFRSKAPMYAKDTQPTDDGTKETQYDKNISKFNNPKGVKENHIVAGKFVDDMNKTQFVNFNVNEAEKTKEPKGTKLVLEGMGNTYTQGVNENVEMRNMMDSFDFYINAGKVSKVAKGKQTLTEGEEKKPINEQLEKMKKLWNYKPEGHLSTSNVKKNRGF